VLPIVWTNARLRGHAIEDIALVLVRARAFCNLSKGAIASGSDADFGVRSDATFTLRGDHRASAG
jgi:hypothetical protein